MTRVLVTGAGGFTGRYLVPFLASRGWQVSALTQTAKPRPPRHGVEWLAIDMTDAEGLTAVVAKVSPQAVIHLAGISSPARGDFELIYRVNLSGTGLLLDALAALPKPPDMVLLASSANIYAPEFPGRISEDAPLGPVNHYGLSKLAMEYLRGVYGMRLPITIVRPFNYTGRTQSHNFVIPKIVNAFAAGVDRIELGNIDVSRDWSDVRTVVDTYEKLLRSTDAVGQILNVCSGSAISLRNIIDMASQISGRTLAIGFNPTFARQNEISSIWGSCDRLKAVIDDYAPLPFEHTLRWMLEPEVDGDRSAQES